MRQPTHTDGGIQESKNSGTQECPVLVVSPTSPVLNSEFDPVELRGESLSATLLRDRR